MSEVRRGEEPQPWSVMFLDWEAGSGDLEEALQDLPWASRSDRGRFRALLWIGQNNRPMFECDGPERRESVIISFSFELDHTRRPADCLSNDWRPSGPGLASGHSECDKRVTGDPPTAFTACHQNRQRLAGYAEL